MSKRKAAKQTWEDEQLLISAFPLVFRCKGEIKMPLKIGVREDIVAAGLNLPEYRLRAALTKYCSSPRYHLGVLLHRHRYNLNGEEVGTITKDEAEHAAEYLSHKLGAMISEVRRLKHLDNEDTPEKVAA